MKEPREYSSLYELANHNFARINDLEKNIQGIFIILVVILAAVVALIATGICTIVALL